MQGPFLHPKDKKPLGEVSKSTWAPCLEVKQGVNTIGVEWGLETTSACYASAAERSKRKLVRK